MSPAGSGADKVHVLPSELQRISTALLHWDWGWPPALHPWNRPLNLRPLRRRRCQTFPADRSFHRLERHAALRHLLGRQNPFFETQTLGLHEHPNGVSLGFDAAFGQFATSPRVVVGSAALAQPVGPFAGRVRCLRPPDATPRRSAGLGKPLLPLRNTGGSDRKCGCDRSYYFPGIQARHPRSRRS
ncbi:hypothetical protein FHS25_001530 [Rhizobium laguerreae]|uniref:Uncharacterized protein n=1 Tax=Rhizobium laguerreae TaxID=1076926 RepID=A0ABR6G476_9HYPH|nr:hypothetical protein [Rhizobium laguerreae]